jgi:Tfp pilus assembly protein FimT
MNSINERGQGTTEYVVILAVVVGIAIFFFKSGIATNVENQISSIASEISSAGGSGGGQ